MCFYFNMRKAPTITSKYMFYVVKSINTQNKKKLGLKDYERQYWPANLLDTAPPKFLKISLPSCKF